jgi:hypothetical protein
VADESEAVALSRVIARLAATLDCAVDRPFGEHWDRRHRRAMDDAMRLSESANAVVGLCGSVPIPDVGFD